LKLNIYKPVQTISFILGTWAFSKIDWGAQPSGYLKTFETVLQKGKEYGFHCIDTAPIYGLTQVEQDLGRLSVAKEYSVSSKFGLKWCEPYSHKNIEISFTSASIIKECEESLSRLNREQLSHYFLHYAPFGGLSEKNIADITEAVTLLKASGKIASFGLSNCTADDVLQMQEQTTVDAIQFECSAYKKWALKKHAMSIVNPEIETWVYSPLARGLLSGKYLSHEQLDTGDHRTRLKYFNDAELIIVQQRLSTIKPLLEKYGCTYSQLFIQWLNSVLPDPRIILGVRTAEQLRDNSTVITLEKSDVQVINKLFNP
jgi:aryl-alcohol dehydrogenase-like predicted oxidoreductase